MSHKSKSRPYHHGDLFEALVAAGTELLIAEGIASFTLRECARRAGVSHAAPKNHFASVGDLLCEIAARGFEQFVAKLEAAANAAHPQSPEARLIAMGRAYVAFAQGNPAVYSLMFRHAQDFQKTEHLKLASEAAWRQLLDGVTAVIGPDRNDALARAAHVWALVHGIASLIIDRRLPMVEPETVIAQSLASLPAAIRALGPT
jgi:AcrR family transcriptional regulator